MSFNWEKYLELAEYIYKNSDSLPDKEAGYRASASRAYYAVFCTIRRYVRGADGKEYKGGDAHKKVQERLKKSRDPLRRTIGNQLEKLHLKRIKADYYDVLRETPYNLAKDSISHAKKIISEIKELSAT